VQADEAAIRRDPMTAPAAGIGPALVGAGEPVDALRRVKVVPGRVLRGRAPHSRVRRQQGWTTVTCGMLGS
jgi:hypothetical protein